MCFLEQAEEAFHFGNSFEQRFSRCSFQQQYFGVLHRIDVVRCRRAGEETVEIGNPPVFNRELDDVLLSLVIDRICSKTTTIDKGDMLAQSSLLKEKLMFPDLLGRKELIQESTLFLREMDPPFNMSVKQGEHIQR